MNLFQIFDKSRSEKRKEPNLALSVFQNKHSIRTFAILITQNPVTIKATSSYYKKANKSLRSILDKYSYTYVPVKGKFGGNIENSYFVINPKFEAVQKLAEKFNQSSFLYGEVYDDRFDVKAYQLQDPDKPFSTLSTNFEYINTSSAYFTSEDAVDNYSQIANKLKFNISLRIL